MTSTAVRPDPVLAGTSRRGLRRLLDAPELRWALLATVLFGIGALSQLAGAPAPVWWPLYLACYVAGGWEPARAGVEALRHRTLDVDLLMIVAAIVAAAIGQVFDGSLLIVIFATSGALEALATQRTADSVRALLDVAPERATRLTPDGREETIDTADLAVGDVVVVRPGERIGADARVVEGLSEVDQASITGEPLPVAKGPADEVFAGTVNGTGSLRVEVQRAAADSVVARIVAMVEQASATKATTQLFIEKVEQRYSTGMVVATLALFLIPLAFGADVQPTLLRAITFMIVASPCAVVLATMPPLLSAMANAGRHGVLVKSAVVMEQLADVDTTAFDKTGTLTAGRPVVVDVHAVDPALTGDDVLTVAAAAERPSEHPLGRAITAAADRRGLPSRRAHDFVSTPGRGVTALVDGRRVRLGSPASLDPHQDRAAADQVRQHSAHAEARGQTAVVLLVDDRPSGVLALADELRTDAAQTVTALSDLTGRAPMLLTGDNPATARTLAAHVGITDVHAELLPADKAGYVHELHRAGRRVLVVGDGVNDAPALAAADVGIAMGRHGSDLALEAADAVIVRDELSTVPRVISLSRRARRVVVANLVIAATVITALVVWDLAGHLPLPLGVAGHEGSTVIVGLNGLRLLRASAWRRAGERRH